MTPWWERHSGRLLQDEVDALAARGLDFYPDDAELAVGRIVLVGAAPAGRLGLIEVAIVYPGTFPHTRPTIYQVTGDRVDRHQSPLTGAYCLIGRSSDFWRPSMTAAELLDGLPDLVDVVDQGGDALREAEDPQGEPITSYYQTLVTGCILVPDGIDKIPSEMEGGRLKVWFRNDPAFLVGPTHGRSADKLGQGLLVEVVDDDGNVLVEADHDLAELFKGATWAGRWLRVDEKSPPAADPSSFAHALAAQDPRVDRPGSTPSGKWTYAIHAALFTEEIRQGEHGQSLLFLARGSRKLKKNQRQYSQALVRGVPYTRETLTERIAPLRGLGRARTAILGLGTLGASLAKMMAQAQIGRLRLADFDVVDPNTTVRWPAGLPAAGIRKDIYLKAELAAHYPFVDIAPTPLQVGTTPAPGQAGEQDDLEALVEWATEADLVIDATAEDNVQRAIAEIATDLQRPQMYVWSIDGYGGVVALIRPGTTGCLHCLSRALSGGDITPPPNAENEDATRVQPRSCADPTFVAAAVDMQPLATQAARVACAFLTEGDDDGYGVLDNDVFVLAVRRSDGKPLPAPAWQSYKLPRTAGCWYCQR